MSSAPASRPPLAVAEAGRFIVRRWPVVLGLCLIAAGGRAAQTGVPALEPGIFQLLFEIVVNAARVALGLAAIGDGNPAGGWRRLRRLLALPQDQRERQTSRAFAALRADLRSLFADIGLYLLIAVIFNLAIAFIVHLPDVQAWAIARNLPHEGETPLALLLKNLTSIPFTIVFQVLLIRRIWRWGR